METFTLPTGDIQSLANLALGTSVLQLGFTDGHDTVALAKTANFVLAAGQSPTATRVHSQEYLHSWDKVVHDNGCGDKVIGSGCEWMSVVRIWPAHSFGLAVVNPYVFDGGDVMPALHMAGFLATRVVVIDNVALDAEPLVHSAFDRDETMITRSGRLWVVSHAPDAVAWTKVEG